MDAMLCSSFIRTQWRFTLNDEHNIVLVFFAYFLLHFFQEPYGAEHVGLSSFSRSLWRMDT